MTEIMPVYILTLQSKIHESPAQRRLHYAENAASSEYGTINVILPLSYYIAFVIYIALPYAYVVCIVLQLIVLLAVLLGKGKNLPKEFQW